MVSTTPDYETIAARAAAQYGVKRFELGYLQHSENVTFCVQARRKRYLLRIHTPITPDMGAHGNNALMIESELRWVEALRRHGMQVQYPVKNEAGVYVTQVDGFNCSLLGWLEGQDFTRNLETEETAAQMGAIVGQLHSQSSKWRRPAHFTRPARDIADLGRVINELAAVVDYGLVSGPDFWELATALDQLSALLANTRQSRRTYGLIHADLHRGNFIYNDGQLFPIDFSLCADGWFLYDLSITLGSISEYLRPWVLEHYQRVMPLPKHWERLLEGFYLANMAGNFLFMMRHPEAQETLVRRFPVIAQEYAARFNADEHFWF